MLVQAELEAGANERYDIGLFLALDGGDAFTGQCHHEALAPPLADINTYNPGTGGIGGAGGPFYNAEESEDPADTCGDLEQGVKTYFDLMEIVVDCKDDDGDGFLDIGHLRKLGQHEK